MTNIAMMTNSHAPLPATTPIDASIATDKLQPLVKAISEEKHVFQPNILGKRVKDDINLEILNFYSLKDNNLSFSLNPKPASLVTVMKYQGGEFVEVKSSSSYNSSMCLRDMKKAISAALDSCITQSNAEEDVVPSPPRPSPRRDVTAAENSSQGKSVSPKSTPPKRVVEDNTGTSEDITSVSEGSKGQTDSPKNNIGSKGTHTGSKGAHTGSKGTHTGSKATPEVPKLSEKSKKTPEKAKQKTTEVPKEKPQPAKEKIEEKPEKPAQTRVKKIKVPDEESIKFANRQREIQKMKKELKERLKREGKDGVDPATRMNAWGRTVGVTCTMCGNHVQKSYGCFRRDTAPAKLVHLFTPGMNRIKICRRCLPYKKQAGKPEQENRVVKPGLMSMPNNPEGLNPGTNTPITIAPLPDKPVSATTLNAIHRKVTGQESTARENTARVNIIASHVNNPGLMNNPAGLVNNGSGQMNNSAGHMNIDSAHVNTDSVHVIDMTAPGMPSEIDLSGESSKGSAIEYIRKLALNLRTNYNGQQGDGSLAGNQDLVTPEEQIIKTPILEHLSNFTPVTPSMNLANEVTTSVNVPGAQSAQWKPVLNQVIPVNQPITPENTTGFVQRSEGNVIPTPPWTSLPIVLTSRGQVPRGSKSAPIQTFVTTANQKDLKLLPAIMVPSQSALPRQGPVVLQIQRVKLVRDRPPGEKAESKGKTTEDKGKQNEMVEQSESGFRITDFGGYTGNISTGSHQPLPEEISSTEVENSISNFLSQAKEISPAQVQTPTHGNFQTLTGEISSAQVEASTVDLESIAGEMVSCDQVGTSTDDIKKITEEIASLIEDASGYTQDKDANMVDAIGHLGTEQDTERIGQDQSEKASETLDIVDPKILESGFLQPSEGLGDQILTSGGLGISYSQHEPAVVLCGSADITSQDATMYPSGYEMSLDRDGGQGGILGGSTNSCVRNIFESQISEEYLPQANDEKLNERSKVNDVDLEKLNEMNKLEQEAVTESIKDSGLLPEDDHSEEKELPDVHDVKSASSDVSESKESNLSENELQDIASQDEKLEATGEEFSMEMKEDAPKIEERKEDVEKESSQKDGSQGEVRKDKTDSNTTTKASEKQAKAKEIRTKIAAEEKSISSTLAIDENITLDLRRSQRRTASPRKPSPGKSPAKQIEQKVHGTRQQRQKQAEHGAQKDKPGPQAAQRGKTERQGSQKDEKEPEATQGVKRKRQGRGTKPAKVLKQ
ncbi:Hypothetical predicted protein [Paramuricea clavata]|nr:Hypothetical predicted protein [Paramuricea clavata]